MVSHFFFTSLVQCFVTQLSIRQADRRQELSAVVSRAVSDARSGVGSAAVSEAKVSRTGSSAVNGSVRGKETIEWN